MTDIPNDGITFVDPAEVADTYRVCLWAAPGQGKSVAAASAPAPIMVLSADRPMAYKYARKHHRHTADSLREVRYIDHTTLEAVYRYLASPEGAAVRTLVVDPVSHIVDALVDVAPANREGGPDYQWINKKVLGFVKSLRTFDINVILIAHEKLNDGKKGDGKLYPALGGAGLINKLLAEMDIVAHVERIVTTSDDGEHERWIGQIQPRDNLVCKDGTNALGDRRIADLTRWFELASEALAPDESDIPFSGDFEPPAEDEPAVREQTLEDVMNLGADK